MKCLCALLFFVVTFCSAAQAASLYSSVREGVDLYENDRYEEALKTFLDAQVENPESAVLKFDIASCNYKLQKYEEAATGYLDVVSTAKDAELEAQALYNIGNAMYRQGKLEEAVEYYKKTLELDSEDEDARKNLEFVREEIKRRKNEAQDTKKRQKEGQKDSQQDKKDDQQDKQDGQQDDQQDQQDKQDGQQDDQQDGQQDKQDGQQDGQQDKQDKQDGQQDGQQDKQDGQQEQQQQGAPEGGSGREDDSRQAEDELRDIAGSDRPMSAEEAEQWLNGLEENREKLQEFRRRSQPGKSRRPEKDW